MISENFLGKNRVTDWVQGPRDVKWNFRCRHFNDPKNDKTKARKNCHVTCLVCLSLANHICIQNEPEQPENIVVWNYISFIHEI